MNNIQRQYQLAEIAKFKLLKESKRNELNMHKLVCHANFLDKILEEIDLINIQTQEKDKLYLPIFYENTTTSNKMEFIEDEEDSDEEDSDDDDDLDPFEDVYYNNTEQSDSEYIYQSTNTTTTYNTNKNVKILDTTNIELPLLIGINAIHSN